MSATHWKVLDDPKVGQVVRNAAKSIARMNQGVLEEDDLYQEGMIMVAATPHIAEQAITGEYGLLFTRVRKELMQKFVEKMQRSGELDARKFRNVSIENEVEPPARMFDDGSADYTAEAVQVLLPAVWDDSYAMRLPDRDDAPDQDMPKAASNRARSNNHWAYIADIKTGWKDTPLTLVERRSLFLTYAMAWTQDEIAEHEGVTQRAVSHRITTGVNKITARLNGARITTKE